MNFKLCIRIFKSKFPFWICMNCNSNLVSIMKFCFNHKILPPEKFVVRLKGLIIFLFRLLIFVSDEWKYNCPEESFWPKNYCNRIYFSQCKIVGITMINVIDYSVMLSLTIRFFFDEISLDLKKDVYSLLYPFNIGPEQQQWLRKKEEW